MSDGVIETEAALDDFAVFARYPQELIDHDNIDHYRAMAARRLAIRRCDECGTWVYPHRPICPACLSWSVPFREVSGRGRVFMETRLHQLRDPNARVYAPLVAAAIELKEQAGLRYLGRIVNCEPEDIALDMPVQLTWLDEHGAPWPAFEPARD